MILSVSGTVKAQIPPGSFGDWQTTSCTDRMQYVHAVCASGNLTFNSQIVLSGDFYIFTRQNNSHKLREPVSVLLIYSL